MHSLRTATIALAAAAALAAPLAAVTSAEAADRSRPVVKVTKGAWLSPNGDHSQDRGRIRFTLAKRSDVTVQVRSTNKAGTVVTKKDLGKLSAGSHSWTWNGKNRKGRVVRDGRYAAVFVADQVAKNGGKRRARVGVYVDTRFSAPPAPKVNADTVFPHTTLLRDEVGITLGDGSSADPRAGVHRVVMTMKDAAGHTALKTRRFNYVQFPPYEAVLPILITGRDADGKPLPAGPYSVRFKVWDKAGNSGRSRAVTVHVSDKPLVEASGSVLVAPTGSWNASQLPAAAPATTRSVRQGRSAMRGGDDPQPIPCGTVVPSAVYADPGAMSFRSANTCGGTADRPSVAGASGSIGLDTLTPLVAPRGLRTSWLSMRGKPTVAGETDTAKLYPGSSFPYLGSSFVSSAPVAQETVTTTQPVNYPWEPIYSSLYTRDVRWAIVTQEVDSYDVASVTVHYTYLTPQAG